RRLIKSKDHQEVPYTIKKDMIKVRQMDTGPETIPKHIDIPDHLVVGRSSSAAKKADAVFKISLARSNAAVARVSLRITVCSSLLTPAFLPESTSACTTHRRSPSVETLNF